MKKVSVIVPCYRLKQEWLERLFHSLEKQTIGIEELEIIFVISNDSHKIILQIQKEKELKSIQQIISNLC